MVFDALMPHWVEFNQMRTGKDLELFDEFSSFKKQKVTFEYKSILFLKKTT